MQLLIAVLLGIATAILQSLGPLKLCRCDFQKGGL